MKMDAGQAAEVWRRVRGEQSATRADPIEDIQGLILEEWTAAATYLQLSRRMQGKEAAARCQQLFREEQAHVACLRGIYTLVKGVKPASHNVPVEQERVEIALRKCYGRQMRMLMEYEKRSADREYGPVFARLAEQEREHCRMVLELIGSLGQK